MSITISKTASPIIVTPGNNVTFNIVVRTVGTFTNVVITDTLPPGFTPISFTPRAGSSAFSTVTTIPPFALYPIVGTDLIVLELVASVDSTVSPGLITNKATVRADGVAPINGFAFVSVLTSPPNLAITKSASPSTVSPGSQVIFAITVTNNTGAPDTVTVTDTLPAGVTFVSASPTIINNPVTTNSTTITNGNTTNNIISNCTRSNSISTTSSNITTSDIIFNPVTIPAGASQTFTIVAIVSMVNSNVIPGASLLDTATVTGLSGLTATAVASVNVIAPTLTLTKFGPKKSCTGEKIEYIVILANNGTVDANNVILKDSISMEGKSDQSKCKEGKSQVMNKETKVREVMNKETKIREVMNKETKIREVTDKETKVKEVTDKEKSKKQKVAKLVQISGPSFNTSCFSHLNSLIASIANFPSGATATFKITVCAPNKSGCITNTAAVTAGSALSFNSIPTAKVNTKITEKKVNEKKIVSKN